MQFFYVFAVLQKKVLQYKTLPLTAVANLKRERKEERL
jgi:hypothetical protein